MSFIAICERCNRRDHYLLSHQESLRNALAAGWQIAPDIVCCPNCTKSLTGSTAEHDEIESVDGSDVDRVTHELIARGGADAILGQFLRDKVAEYYATVDPVSCV